MNIICLSGGKDSSAMVLRMKELDMKIDKILFADTTLEFPEIYEWLGKLEEILGQNITRVTADHTFDDWFYGKFSRGKHKDRIRGFPYLINKCWWSRDSKIIPLEDAQGEGNNIFIGIAHDEKERANANQYVNRKNKYNFPLIEWRWTERKCIDYLKRRDLLQDIHTKFERTGCWLCPKQSEKSLITLYKEYPILWEKLKKYEKDSPHGFKPDFKLSDIEESINRNEKQKTLTEVE